MALGFAVDVRPSTVGDANVLKDFTAGFVVDTDAVTEVGHQVADVAGRAREALDALGEADLVSQDLVIEILDGLEHHLWMLRAQTAGRAGNGDR